MSRLNLDKKIVQKYVKKIINNHHVAFPIGICLVIFAFNFSKNYGQNDRIKEIKSRPEKSC